MTGFINSYRLIKVKVLFFAEIFLNKQGWLDKFQTIDIYRKIKINKCFYKLKLFFSCDTSLFHFLFFPTNIYRKICPNRLIQL